jgi:hypothetical protein
MLVGFLGEERGPERVEMPEGLDADVQEAVVLSHTIAESFPDEGISSFGHQSA